jgi:hypothetical protein
MLSRWIQANQRFLAMVGGAALLLLVFQWLFVSGKRADAAAARTTYGKQTAELKRLYTSEDPPLDWRVKQRADERTAVEAALDAALRTYGNRPESPFVLPAGEETGAQNYYFEQRNAVIDAVRQAAQDAAVNVADETLGLPEQLPPGADPVVTVRHWLWNLQVVRRAALAAIAAQVDVIEKMTEVRGDPRAAREQLSGKVHEVVGYPLAFEVGGSAASVARWLESLQSTDGFLVLVQCKLKRESQQLGVVRCQVVLMGADRRSRSEE